VTDELTAEQEAAVRRLLSQARHDAPVPADVAARLDEVLAGLVADEGVDDLEIFESDGVGSVVELAGVRRRRRNAGRLLLAAAAVIVGGVAVGQSLDNAGLDMGGGGAGEGSSLADAPRDADSADRAGEEAAGGDDSAVAPEAASSPAPGETALDETYLLDQLDAPLELTSDNFAADVQRELGRTAAERRTAADANLDGVAAFTSSNSEFVCAAGAYGEGATLPAYYDAEEAVLVLRRPRAGIQRVDLLTCGTAVQLDSVDLPAP
jgi:hypothetical protein